MSIKIIQQPPYFYDSVFNVIDKGINPENETFIDGIIRISKEFVHQPYTHLLKERILYSIQQYTNEYFHLRNWELAWKAYGEFDYFTQSFKPYFLSIGDTEGLRPIDMEEAQARINKFGWRVHQYEQDLHERLKGHK